VNERDRSSSAKDRLICLSEAVALVPFSDTTLRRAIARGELEAWRPTRNGKLVIWQNALIAWATRRPAAEELVREGRRERRLSSRQRRRIAAATQTPDPITLPNLT
jgi:hypothetical protein